MKKVKKEKKERKKERYLQRIHTCIHAMYRKNSAEQTEQQQGTRLRWCPRTRLLVTNCGE